MFSMLLRNYTDFSLFACFLRPILHARLVREPALAMLMERRPEGGLGDERHDHFDKW